MFHQIWKISLLIFIVSSLNESSASMQCYNCISPMANDCRDTTQMTSIDCGSAPGGQSSLDPVCMKIVNIEPRTAHYVVTKMCAWEGSSFDPCASYTHGNVQYCSTCSSKLCNSSSKAIVSILTLALMVLITKIIN